MLRADDIAVRPVRPQDLPDWINMRIALWPSERAEHQREVSTYFIDGCIDTSPHVVFLALIRSDTPIGLIEVSLRGATGNSPGPRAHVEGWFVDPANRNRGVGRDLMIAAIAWARSRGCRYLTSDTSPEYAALSIPAHIACGFIVDPELELPEIELDTGTTRLVLALESPVN